MRDGSLGHYLLRAAHVGRAGSRERRGAFYEATGALREMVPKHILSLLSLVAMEPPVCFDAASGRTKEAEVSAAMPTATAAWAVRSQFGAGVVLGERVKAYRRSRMSWRIRTSRLTSRWVRDRQLALGSVPFYVRTGKHMAQRTTEIAIGFKQAPYSAFQDTPVNSLRGLTGGAGHRAEPGNLPAVRGQAPWACVGPRRREDGFRHDVSPRSRTSDTRR